MINGGVMVALDCKLVYATRQASSKIERCIRHDDAGGSRGNEADALDARIG